MPSRDAADLQLNSGISIEYVGEFQLSVTRALRDQLLERLTALTAAPLTPESLATLARRGGVYQLFDGDELVYVGKSTRDLPGRLLQHHRKLLGRGGGILERVGFRCVYVSEDLDALAPEKMLIDTLRQHGQAAWNTNGFGNKDPGKERDNSLVEAGHFDRLFPINMDLEVGVSQSANALELARALKAALPYNFRFANTGAPASALERQPLVGIDFSSARPVREWVMLLAEAMPPGWSIIQLPGYLIGYPSIAPEIFRSRTGAWIASAEGASYSPHTPEYAVGVPVE